VESWRTSEAATANPLPTSPARAASIEAFSANSRVWAAMRPMTVTAVSSLNRCVQGADSRLRLPRLLCRSRHLLRNRAQGFLPVDGIFP